MKKISYIALVVAYGLLFPVYFFRYEIMCQLLNVQPEVIEQRSLTYGEYVAMQQAAVFSAEISDGFTFASCIVCLLSAIFWYWRQFSPLVVPKIVFFISGFFALVLIVVNAIGFVPDPPIR